LNKKLLFILFSLFAILALFCNCGLQALYADEPTRALVSLEMIINNTWLPTINGEVYLNKPPLYNWILVGFYKIFGISEFSTRLPAILSLLIFGLVIYHFVHSFTINKIASFFVAMAVLTSGNMLFYSSLLGHIDALFSLVVFFSFMLAYKHGRIDNWSALFRLTYLLCFVGFMLKGLPSLVFQGITILVVIGHFKKWNILFSWKHLLNSLWFSVPLFIYLLLFSTEYNLSDFLINLWQESGKRTVLQKSFYESIRHIFIFPFQFIADTLPWSFIGLIFLNKKARSFVKENSFLHYCLLLFLANIIVYWLAPDSRARYLMMLFPLFFTVLFVTWFQRNEHRLVNQIFLGITRLAPVALIALFLWFKSTLIPFVVPFIFIFILSLIMNFIFRKNHKKSLWQMLFLMLTVRLGMDLIILPERIKFSEYTAEKKEAFRISDLSEGKPLSMYCSNLPHNSTFYISLKRNQILHIKTLPNEYNLDEMYLIPSALINDPGNTKVLLSFTRRFENMQFSLVKFTKGFPENKKDD